MADMAMFALDLTDDAPGEHPGNISDEDDDYEVRLTLLDSPPNQWAKQLTGAGPVCSPERRRGV